MCLHMQKIAFLHADRYLVKDGRLEFVPIVEPHDSTISASISSIVKKMARTKGTLKVCANMNWGYIEIFHQNT